MQGGGCFSCPCPGARPAAGAVGHRLGTGSGEAHKAIKPSGEEIKPVLRPGERFSCC